jgi:DMSO/TMAO reductase YedYZ molybdopterin-dependent catalytic subunit
MIRRPLRTPVLALLLIVAFSPASAQERPLCARAQPGNLVVHGDIAQEVVIPLSELRTMPRTTINANLHNGEPARFEGVTLRELLTRAGVPAELRSGDLTRYMVVDAADGYRALFALAELDPAFRETLPILADTQNGQPLDAQYGPVQVIVPGEARHARWVRQVTCLRLGRHSGTP